METEMSQKEIEAAINSLCLIGHYSILFRIVKNVPGAFQVSTSGICVFTQHKIVLSKLVRTEAAGAVTPAEN